MNIAELTKKWAENISELQGRQNDLADQLSKGRNVSTEQQEKIAGLIASLKDIQDQLREIQMKEAREDMATTVKLLNPGARFAKSEELAAYVKSGVRSMERAFQLKGGFGRLFQKDLTSAADSGGAAIDPFREAGIVPLKFELPVLRSIISVLGMPPTGAVEYVRENTWHDIEADLTADAAAAQADVVVGPDAIEGWYVGLVVTLEDDTPDTETATILSINKTTGTLTMDANLANTYETAQNAKVYASTFIATAETAEKPRAELTLELVTDTLKTIAHHTTASRQILSDAMGLEAHINFRLINGVMRAENKQILYGTGGSLQLKGVLATPGFQSITQVGPDSKLDVLRKAITLLRNSNHQSTAIVVHPDDWQDIELLKGTDGHYIWVGAPNTGAGAQVWRVAVIETTAIDSGTACVGDFASAVQLREAESAMIRVSEHHNDNFTRNMITILGESRVLLQNFYPDAFVNVTFI